MIVYDAVEFITKLGSGPVARWKIYDALYDAGDNRTRMISWQKLLCALNSSACYNLQVPKHNFKLDFSLLSKVGKIYIKYYLIRLNK